MTSASAIFGRATREQASVIGIVMLMTILGGGPASAPAPRFVAAILACGLVGLVLISNRNVLPSRFTFADSLVIAVPLLIVAHLVPLPSALWTALPGRTLGLDIDMAVFGRAGWRPLSVDPSLTAEAAAQLLPALATYFAIRTGSPSRLVAVLDGVLIAGCLGLALGVFQMLFPNTAAFMPYARGDYFAPTGFFTNHNHQAVFLECLFPLAVIRGSLAPWTRRPLPADLTVFLGFGLTAVLVCVVLATASRMGAVLLLPLLVLSALALRGERTISIRRVLVLGAGLALLTALGGARLIASLQRGDLDADQRWDFYRDVWQANLAYWPAGSGIGTCPVAFAPYEPLAHLGPHYLNHAHNDYLEIAIEAGAAGVVLAGVALLWFLLRMAKAYRQGTPKHAPVQMVQRLACIPLFILLLHSLFDYPLRTLAIEIVAVACVAILSGKFFAGPSKNYRTISSSSN